MRLSYPENHVLKYYTPEPKIVMSVGHVLTLLCTCLLRIPGSHAQDNTGSLVVLSGSAGATLTAPNLGSDGVPTGSYLSYTTTSTNPNGTIADIATTIANANATATATSATTSSASLLQGTVIGGSSNATNATTASNSTASRTTSAAPTNTQPCNNYPELCSRKYSNITFVAAHNSPFITPNNIGANQELGVFSQLNDGIRMLQGETHWNSSTQTISYCHTSCDLLDAGTALDYFSNITDWVRRHPYDVVTLLLVNSDYIGVGNYTTPLINSGLTQYAFEPPQVPMTLESWPSLGQMILTGKRVVIFMDYNANQTEIPYILDQFSQVWETPFSPTNRSFPCTQQRPPDLDRKAAEDRMYLANHNLNTEVAFLGTSVLTPTTTLVNDTNAVSGFGSLGLMANSCVETWSRPPNFLLVDYYNEGNFPGSVFEVAAQHNNVTYNRPCCGKNTRSGASKVLPPWMLLLASGLFGVFGSLLGCT